MMTDVFRLLAAASLSALAVTATSSQAAELFNNGPVVNAAGLSLLSPPSTTFGFTASTVPGVRVADNFSVTGAGWNVSSLDFFSYQMQPGTGVFTFTSATWGIVSGADVNTGAVVASGTTAVTNAGLVGYRAQASSPANQNRAIFRINADIPDLTLAAGNYFLTWSLATPSTSGPFVPPVLDSLGAGNALQSLSVDQPFSTISENGSGRSIELPFAINGTVVGAVPEPATWAMMIVGFGAAGGALRRRRKVTTRVSYAV